jgi:signal transduction histidine kinase
VSRTSSVDEQRRRLLEFGRSLVADLDPDAVLGRVLEAARELTGARYAALGVLDETRTELERFVTAGIDDATHRAIGDLPRGRGVLGVLIAEPQPLRLADVGHHPLSYGFPAAHPVMRTFLGVPVILRAQAWGNLYLCDKDSGEFTESDEETAVVLAAWAGTAIDNARLYQTSERRRQELERAVRGLEATRDVAIAIGSETRLDRVLELIAKRGRALVEARSVVIMLVDGDDLVVIAAAGQVERAQGRRVPIDGSTSGEVLVRGRPERIADVGARLRISAAELGVPDAHTALIVPMVHRAERLGVVAAFDRGGADETFTATDEQLLRAFSASAGNAVTLARSVEADRLRSSLAAADSERRRWARELHDETLQALAGLRVLLSSAHRTGDPVRRAQAIESAIEQLGDEIANLRAIISDLRPAALDELGLEPALDALVTRQRTSDLEIACDVRLDGSGRRLEPELETAVYRILQEALTNVVKHAAATSVTITVTADEAEVIVELVDDGSGFDPEAATSGFGLAGMRERARLQGGQLELTAATPSGTRLLARLPAVWVERRHAPRDQDSVAS